MRYNIGVSRQLLFKKIHVIESLPHNEMRTGKDLNDDCLYYNSFKLSGVKHEYTRVETQTEFLNSIGRIRNDMVQNDESPIIHLELHGNENGLLLANGKFIEWSALKKAFQEINLLCKNNLFLTLAVCRGAYLIDIIDMFDTAPYWGFLAPREVISVGSASVVQFLLYWASPNIRHEQGSR